VDALAPSRELAALLAGGEVRRAGEWLVARYARDVIGLCRSMVRERALAEDLAQDVFAQAFSSLRGYRGEAAPRTWLLSIARNRCVDQMRRAAREPWDEPDDGNEPDMFADEAPLPAELLMQRSDVHAALDELAESERALVVLRFRHGLEYPELASVFGLKEGTVRMRLSRALGKMRERLERREAAELAEEATPTGRAAPLPESRSRAAIPLGRPAFGTSAPSAPPVAAPAPPPAAAMPPPAPRVVAAPAPPAPMAGAGPRVPEPGAPEYGAVAARAKGGGFFDRLRAFFSGAPEVLAERGAEPAPPATPFAALLAEGDAEPSVRFTDKLAELLAALPGR